MGTKQGKIVGETLPNANKVTCVTNRGDVNYIIIPKQHLMAEHKFLKSPMCGETLIAAGDN